MKLLQPKFLVPASAGLLLSFSATPDRVAFAPEKGLSVTRSFETRVTMDLEDMTLEMDGQDMTAMMGGLPEMSMTTTNTVSVTDEFVEMGQGRPKKLKRTYDSIASNTVVDVSMMGEGQSNETAASSDLEGGTVVFTWDDEKGEFGKRWADENETRDADLLEGLEEDMDLRQFLPTADVEVGTSWDIPTKALLSLVMPGGNLGMEPDDMDSDMGDMDMDQITQMFEEMMDEYSSTVEELFSGERKATYEGRREIDGTTYAVISLKLDTDGTVDLSGMIEDLIDRMMEITESDVEVDLTISTADLNVTIDGSGQLLWDPKRNTFASLTMTNDISFSVEVSMDVDAMGEAHSMDMTLEMSGDTETKISAR
ncbi:MAG: hypothetical protein KDA28_07195 [Phycisphaerales bacterium]|nr:hypothetical protein [Phycisphaerales bacterium]